MVLVKFGTKYYASKVFKDQKPRDLNEVFEISYIHQIISRIFPENFLLKDILSNIPEEGSHFQELDTEITQLRI